MKYKAFMISTSRWDNTTNRQSIWLILQKCLSLGKTGIPEFGVVAHGWDGGGYADAPLRIP